MNKDDFTILVETDVVGAHFDSKVRRINQAKGLREMLALGGFNLTKWMSTSRTILEQLREFGLANPTVDLNFDELPIEKTLGVL